MFGHEGRRSCVRLGRSETRRAGAEVFEDHPDQVFSGLGVVRSMALVLVGN